MRSSVDTQNRQLTETAETLTRARNAGSFVGISNVLDDHKRQEIRALGRLGWTLSHPGCDGHPPRDDRRLPSRTSVPIAAMSRSTRLVRERSHASHVYAINPPQKDRNV